MDVSLLTFNCSPIPGLREHIDEALRETMGPLADEIGRIEVYLDRPGKGTARHYRLQANLQPYGTVMAGRFESDSPGVLRSAVADMALRARRIVLSRLDVAAGVGNGYRPMEFVA